MLDKSWATKASKMQETHSHGNTASSSIMVHMDFAFRSYGPLFMKIHYFK